jgi:GT2 family glycosyltransferase
MPVMNCLDYTKQTIASIKSKIGYDLLVVDNNSKDGTFEWLIHQQKLGALKVFTSAKNLGVARSWNLGLEFGMLTGGYKYFVILNNDLILNPKCIDEMIKALRLQKADLVSGIDNSFMFDDPF